MPYVLRHLRFTSFAHFHPFSRGLALRHLQSTVLAPYGPVRDGGEEADLDERP
jgi:hypothetical protein